MQLYIKFDVCANIKSEGLCKIESMKRIWIEYAAIEYEYEFVNNKKVV